MLKKQYLKCCWHLEYVQFLFPDLKFDKSKNKLVSKLTSYAVLLEVEIWSVKMFLSIFKKMSIFQHFNIIVFIHLFIEKIKIWFKNETNCAPHHARNAILFWCYAIFLFYNTFFSVNVEQVRWIRKSTFVCENNSFKKLPIIVFIF